jgi:hypothetical protein
MSKTGLVGTLMIGYGDKYLILVEFLTLRKLKHIFSNIFRSSDFGQSKMVCFKSSNRDVTVSLSNMTTFQKIKPLGVFLASNFNVLESLGTF